MSHEPGVERLSHHAARITQCTKRNALARQHVGLTIQRRCRANFPTTIEVTSAVVAMPFSTRRGGALACTTAPSQDRQPYRGRRMRLKAVHAPALRSPLYPVWPHQALGDFTPAEYLA